MVQFAFVREKKNFGRMLLNFQKPVHLITITVNEQRVAVVQQVDADINADRLRSKKHISCAVDFLVRRWWREPTVLISRHAERLMWLICFTTVNVDPEISYMAFDGNTLIPRVTL